MIKEDFAHHKKANAQVEMLKPGIATRIQAYFDIHAHALFSSLGRLTRTPTSFALTVLVLAISLALAASFYVFVKNLRQLTGTFESTNQISVYLKKELVAPQIEQLRLKFVNDPKVATVELITPEQGLKEFKARSGLGDALNALDQNPLPPVLVVLPKNSIQALDQVKQLLKQFEQMPGVDLAQMDTEWLQRLNSLVTLAGRGVALLSGLFALAVLLVTSNTIRLELQGRQDEVIVAKLVGATNAFIRRPFLYTGFWLGFSAGVLAWFIVIFVLLILQEPVEELSSSYASNFKILYLDYLESLALLGISAGLGIMGAWLVLGSQLKQLRPD